MKRIALTIITVFFSLASFAQVLPNIDGTMARAKIITASQYSALITSTSPVLRIRALEGTSDANGSAYHYIIASSSLCAYDNMGAAFADIGSSVTATYKNRHALMLTHRMDVRGYSNMELQVFSSGAGSATMVSHGAGAASKAPMDLMIDNADSNMAIDVYASLYPNDIVTSGSYGLYTPIPRMMRDLHALADMGAAGHFIAAGNPQVYGATQSQSHMAMRVSGQALHRVTRCGIYNWELAPGVAGIVLRVSPNASQLMSNATGIRNATGHILIRYTK